MLKTAIYIHLSSKARNHSSRDVVGISSQVGNKQTEILQCSTGSSTPLSGHSRTPTHVTKKLEKKTDGNHKKNYFPTSIYISPSMLSAQTRTSIKKKKKLHKGKKEKKREKVKKYIKKRELQASFRNTIYILFILHSNFHLVIFKG